MQPTRLSREHQSSDTRRKPTPTSEISGGDIYHCLSHIDIDRFLLPILGPHTVPARMTFDVRTNRSSASSAEALIKHKIRTHGWALVPTHVRHHWATSIVFSKAETVSAIIYDSAPSPATRRDFTRLFSRLHINVADVRSLRRQPAGSNECGLHVILLALLQLHALATHTAPLLPENSREFIDLNRWRPVLAHTQATNDSIIDGLLNSVPAARSIFYPATRDTQCRLDTPDGADGAYPDTKTTEGPKNPYPQPTPAILPLAAPRENRPYTHDPYGGGKRTVDPLDRHREPQIRNIARGMGSRPPHNQNAYPSSGPPPNASLQTLRKSAPLQAPSPQDPHAEPARDASSEHATASRPLRWVRIPYLDTPILKSSPDSNGPVIDVDADDLKDLRTTAISWDAIPLSLREYVAPLFAAAAKDQQIQYDRAVSNAKNEFKALHKAQQKSRATEFRNRTVARVFTPETATVTLEDAKLLPPHINEQLRTIAAQTREVQRLHNEENALRDAFATAFVEGQFISSDIINHALQTASTLYPQWLIISSVSFVTYAYRGGLDVKLPAQITGPVAVILFEGGHYTLATAKEEIIEFRDSLYNQMSATTIRLLGRFRTLLAQHGRKTAEEVCVMRTDRQAWNACAIEVINNLAEVITGQKGRMSRALLGDMLADLNNGINPYSQSEKWISIFPPLQPSIHSPNNGLPMSTVHAAACITETKPEIASNTTEPTGKTRATPVSTPVQPMRFDPNRPSTQLKVPVTLQNSNQKRYVTNATPTTRCPGCAGPILSGETCALCEVLDTRARLEESRQKYIAECSSRATKARVSLCPSCSGILTNSSCPICDGKSNRQQQSTVETHRDPNDPCNFPPPVDVLDIPNVTPHDPLPQSRCCKRPSISPDSEWCAWHHPRIASQIAPQCTAKNTNGRRCKELAIVIRSDTDGAWAFASKCCWYHVSDGERRAIRETLAPKELLETNQAATTLQILPARGQEYKPMTHRDVTERMRLQTEKTLVHIDATWFPKPRQSYIARVISHPSTSALTECEWVAAFCQRCGEWHSMDEPNSFVPSVEVLYFGITNEKGGVPDTTPPCESSDETGSDIDPDDDNATVREEAVDLDKEPLTLLCPFESAASQTQFTSARKWFIYPSRPPHVHKGVWSEVSPNTRQSHIRWLRRIHAAPPEMNKTPLAVGAVEIVLRLAKERGWRWSTISSSLSSLATAVRNLPLHSNASHSFDLRKDNYFASALRNAQRKARVDSLHPQKSAPLSVETLSNLGKQLQGPSWVLLQISWYLAARVGDVRRLHPENINIGKSSDRHGNVEISALFAEGKGAHFWGPYTIHNNLPAAVAKSLVEYLSSLPRGKHICSPKDQSILSRVIGEIENHSLRSIRRGSLVRYAQCGASEASLQLLSGHRRRDTLLRYLGWGVLNGEAKNAAAERADLVAANISNDPSGAGTDSSRPTPMGFWSGFNGKSGQRTKAPPSLFPKATPSFKDLGITPTVETDVVDDPKQWPLHVKKIPCLKNVENCHEHVTDPELREATRMATQWLYSSENYGISWPTLAPEQVPFCSFSPSQITEMLREDDGYKPKLEPLGDRPIRCAARGFPAEQPAKRRLRPVFEPLNNKHINADRLPPLHYPSRAERRERIARAKFVLTFDFAAWYDQLPLNGVESCFVIRSRTPILHKGKLHTHFVLTRAPMGASWSAHCAQTLTWAIVEPLLRLPRIDVFTMIDNIAICGDTEEEFVQAIQTFLSRVELFGATLNDAELLPRTREDIIKAAQQNEVTFLGEVYSRGLVSNTQRNLDKLAMAFTRLQEALTGTVVRTKRNVISLIALCNWLAHTLNINPRQQFDLLRLYSRLSSESKWDDPVLVTPFMVNIIARAVGPLLENKPVSPPHYPPPTLIDDKYAAIIAVDASASGYGAYVKFNRPVNGHYCFELRAGWHKPILHSAWAEPLAALEVLRWVRQRCSGRVAVISDHIALTTGQRRPNSGNGGFSPAYHVNTFFAELYSDGLDHNVFYVDGELNIADRISRSNNIGDHLQAKPIRMTFPSLAQFKHPYMENYVVRKWWNV